MVFRWPVRILFIDTDASGRIHYTAMLRYFEAAEIELFRAAGAQEDREKVGFPRVHVECDYKSAIYFDDELIIELSIGNIGRSSIELLYRAMKKGVVAVSGKIVIAAMDPKTDQSVEIPPGLREKLGLWIAPRVSV
ncbi:MAG TPA: thioesterase family protein [Bryobacteraceae bacterium]